MNKYLMASVFFIFLPLIGMQNDTLKKQEPVLSTTEWVLRVTSSVNSFNYDNGLITDIRASLTSHIKGIVPQHPDYWISVTGTKEEIMGLLRTKQWFKEQNLNAHVIAQAAE